MPPLAANVGKPAGIWRSLISNALAHRIDSVAASVASFSILLRSASNKRSPGKTAISLAAGAVRLFPSVAQLLHRRVQTALNRSNRYSQFFSRFAVFHPAEIN